MIFIELIKCTIFPEKIQSTRIKNCNQYVELTSNRQNERNNIFPVDVSRDMQTAQKFGIMGTPSLVLVQGGKIQEFLVGAQTEDKMKSLLQ